MESYTTISVRPKLKKKIKLLKDQGTYNEYLEEEIEEKWEDSEYTDEDLED